MKKMLAVAAAFAVLPIAVQAQTAQSGVYIGAEGGLNWLLNTTVTGQQINNAGTQFQIGVAPQTGWAAGGKIGYDFVGPRVELEAVYRQNQTNLSANNFNTSNLGVVGNQIGQLGILANVLYDFMPGATITPYVGAGAGIGFVDGNSSLSSTVFAYQGIVGLAWNVDQNFRVSLDGRYYGTSNPTLNGVGWSNSNFSVMLGLTYKFTEAAPVAAPPPPAPAAPSFIVFFDWDRSNLSAQALNTIKQAAGSYKTKGSARVTATGHTDKSGPESYNMALSLRRANTVKDALVREGVPATAISVIGKGETQPLVQTADGVREPQNRRVEIVIQ